MSMHNEPNFEMMGDDELVDLCFDVGLDSLPNTNQYGELNNREEVIQALRNSHREAVGESIKSKSFKQWLVEENERRIQTYSGWRAACKRAAPDCHFEGDKDIAFAYIKGEDGKPKKNVGEWDGDHGVVFKQGLKESKKLIVPTLKPRAKELNAALLTKKGGKHYTEKGQYKRAAEKQKARKMMND